LNWGADLVGPRGRGSWGSGAEFEFRKHEVTVLPLYRVPFYTNFKYILPITNLDFNFITIFENYLDFNFITIFKKNHFYIPTINPFGR
jgi:hypothetical protein